MLSIWTEVILMSPVTWDGIMPGTPYTRDSDKTNSHGSWVQAVKMPEENVVTVIHYHRPRHFSEGRWSSKKLFASTRPQVIRAECLLNVAHSIQADQITSHLMGVTVLQILHVKQSWHLTCTLTNIHIHTLSYSVC